MAPGTIDFVATLGLLLGKILAIVEGVLDNWVNIAANNPWGYDLTAAGDAFTAEISDLVEKIMQLIERILEDWFGVAPY